ncbi:MAG: prolyl oligopeptidase family serine peptidase, partial [Acidobacteriota bacterium]
QPGTPNPRVRVGIVNLETARTVWLDRAAEYIPRIDWADSSHVAVQLLDRRQEALELVLADPASGRSRSVFFEKDPYWVDVTDDLTFLADGEHFLWTSHRSGLRHLYLYRRDGQLVRQLTRGEFRLNGIAGVDEAGGWVYFSSNEDNLLGRDLYRIRLDGSGKERLTREKGTHAILMNPDATAWLDTYTALDPSVVRRRTLHDAASGKSVEIFRDHSLADYDLVQPEIETLEAPDGGTVRVMVMKPDKLRRGEKRPMLIYVYGMAGVPTIRDTRRGNRHLFHQFLVQQGYIVGYIDDRSSAIPGHKHAALADHDIGPLAAADAAVAVEHFKSLPYVDGDRLAIWGWSGGGFSTCFQMGHTDLYKVGIAGAPVTDWRLYDSIYTERYMGLLEENEEAYDRTSAVQGAGDVKGRLLLIHGTHDDNVHMQNTLQMINALIENRRQFDLMLYPNKTHGITGADHNMHLYTMIYEYLERHL